MLLGLAYRTTFNGIRMLVKKLQNTYSIYCIFWVTLYLMIGQLLIESLNESLNTITLSAKHMATSWISLIRLARTPRVQRLLTYGNRSIFNKPHLGPHLVIGT